MGAGDRIANRFRQRQHVTFIKFINLRGQVRVQGIQVGLADPGRRVGSGFDFKHRDNPSIAYEWPKVEVTNLGAGHPPDQKQMPSSPQVARLSPAMIRWQFPMAAQSLIGSIPPEVCGTA